MLDLAKKRLAVWIIALPMLLSAVYLFFIAADRYVSESIITVKQSGDTGVLAASGIAQVLGGTTSASREETLYLREYVHSLDMLRYLDAKLGLRNAYEAGDLDIFYRLYPGTSQEWFHWYYTNRVEVVFDDLTSLLSIRVQGFTPEFAQAVNAEILAQCERFVNEISHRLAREQLAFAEGELRTASGRLQEAKARLLAFQNKHGIFDPLSQAQASAALGSQLDAEIAGKEAELKAMLGFMQEDAPAVIGIRNEIAALKSQRAMEGEKVASEKGSRLNRLAAEFQRLVLEAGFAEEAYKAALASVETTRIEASRKLKSLVVVATPGKPETAIYPQRIYNLGTLLMMLTLLYGIVRLVIATVQDHRD